MRKKKEFARPPSVKSRYGGNVWPPPEQVVHPPYTTIQTQYSNQGKE